MRGGASRGGVIFGVAWRGTGDTKASAVGTEDIG